MDVYGSWIIDIGLDPDRPNRSRFYQAERALLRRLGIQ
jgi:hypothetical protein